MGDAGVMGGASADVMTLTTAQPVTGAKTYNDQKLIFKNPAGTFSGTVVNSAWTANVNVDLIRASGAKITVFNDGTNWVAVRDDGVILSTNSSGTTVLQYAVNNLTAARAYKETVKVLGNISLSTITIPSYTILDLFGARVFQANATNLNLFINSDTSGGNSNIEIMGGLIDGNKANQTVDGTNYDTRNTVNFTKCNDSSVHDCYILNSNSNSVFIGQSTNVTVNRCSLITPRKCGVRVDATSTSTPGSNIFITNNYMYNHPESFVTACTTTDVLIEGNLCDICATNGINCTALRQKIINNIIKTCDRAGITLGGEATPFGAGDYAEIIGNTCWECKGGGIFSGVAQGGDYVKIINNLCKGHPSAQDTASGRAYGIRLRGNYGLIEGNHVWGWQRTGISITGVNSTSSFDSRSLASGRVMVKDNIVHTNGQLGATETTNYLKSGIVVFGTGSETGYNTNIKIIGNICYNNIDYGVMFRNSTGTIIEDNDLQGNVTGALLNVTSNL